MSLSEIQVYLSRQSTVRNKALVYRMGSKLPYLIYQCIEKGSLKGVVLLQERLLKLLTVKSIVTIILTIVFAYLSVIEAVSVDQFLTVFTVIIAFYFGTQAERVQKKGG